LFCQAVNQAESAKLIQIEHPNLKSQTRLLGQIKPKTCRYLQCAEAAMGGKLLQLDFSKIYGKNMENAKTIHDHHAHLNHVMHMLCTCHQPVMYMSRACHASLYPVT